MRKQLQTDSFAEMEIPVAVTSNDKSDKVYFQFRVVKNNKNVSIIRCYDIAEEEWKEELTGDMPRLSHDGSRLLYGKMQPDGIVEVMVRDVKKGTEKSIGWFLRAQDFAWSADGRKLLFTAAMMQPCDPPDRIPLKTVRWIDRTKFKTDGVGIFDGTYRRIVIYDLESETLTFVEEGKRDVFSPQFVNEEEIAYLGVPYQPDNSDEYYLYLRNVVKGSCKKYRGPGGPMSHTSVSHDGRKIAVIAHDNHYWEATDFHVYVFDREQESWRCVNEACCRTAGNCVDNDTGYDNQAYSILWERSDESLYVPITDGYSVNVCRVRILTGQTQAVTHGNQVVFSYGITSGGLLTAVSKENLPSAISLLNEQEELEIWKSAVNPQTYNLAESRIFRYSDEDGREREARYFPPHGELKGVVLNIHGGPHYCHGYDFSYDIQLLAANGFGTVLCNPAGSQGSGEEISRTSYHDWGGRDYRELMTCVTELQKTFGLEGCPLAVMGGSYGGFMTNWIVGHTNRFACAVSERSTCNRYSQAGTSDCAFRYGMYEFDGLAWENPRHYMEHSPISYVKNVETPILLLHGDKDMNCPISQSEEWYSALKLEGKEAYFAVFPGEYHDFKGKGSPDCRKERYELLIWWFQRYCRREEPYV